MGPLTPPRTARSLGTARRIWHAACGLIVPPLCAACGASLAGDDAQQVALCEPCRATLTHDDSPCCPRCGETLAPAAERGADCFFCREEKGWRLDAVVRLGRYSGDLRSAILRMKRADEAPLAAALAAALLNQRADELAALDVQAIVPVPMYWTRRWQRGANAPETIAEALARRLRLPLAAGWLVRRRATALLEPLSPTARRAAVHGAFDVGLTRRLAGRWLGAKPPERVLLVDDVLTSGATGNEAARALKRIGVKFVAAAVLARTEKRRHEGATPASDEPAAGARIG